MDNEKFKKCVNYIYSLDSTSNGIGTLGEKNVHSILKYYYGDNLDNQEKKIGNFVADIFKDDTIYEIQTHNFGKLRKKLKFFLPEYEVNIVFPINYLRHVSYINSDTLAKSKAKTYYNRQKIYTIVEELYQIIPLLSHKNLKIIMPILEVDEIRLRDNRRSRRVDTFPLKLLEEIRLNNADEYKVFIPHELKNKTFTSKDFAISAQINIKTARILLLILFSLNQVDRVDKIEKSYLYEIRKNGDNNERN